MRITKSLSLFVAAFVVFAGCSSDPASVTETPERSNVNFSVRVVAPVELAATDSQDELAVRAAAMQSVIAQNLEVISESRDWERAHEGVVSLLGEPSEYPTYIREQVAAAMMLRTELLENPSEKMLPAIAYYTQLLSDNQSPEADLMADALASLVGYWPESQVRSVAQTSVAAAEAHLAQRLDCVDCTGEKILQTLRDRTGSPAYAFYERQASGMAALRALSE
jgi:hypothetical protein